MPKIVSKLPTVMRDPAGSRSPVNVKPGQSLAVKEIVPDHGQMLQIIMGGNAGNLRDGEKWSLYSPHWQFPGLPMVGGGKAVCSDGVKLQVPYYAQCDSRSDGYRYCFSHSCAMATAYLMGDRYRSLSANYRQPENYYIDIVTSIGDTTDSSVQIAALREVGIDAYFTQSVSPKDLYKALSLGVPVPIGVGYKSSGHWICLVGNQGGDWLVHDPYGVRNGSSSAYVCTSTDEGREGAYDVYSQSIMDSVFWDARTSNDRECGWAVIPVAVNGKPTGLPDNL